MQRHDLRLASATCFLIGVLVTAACGGERAAVARHDGGATDASGDADARPNPADAACLASDGDIVSGRTGKDLDAELLGCLKALLTSGTGPDDASFPDGISRCLSMSAGLSPACAACYGTFADCSADQCLLVCIGDPSATTCTDCRCGRSAARDCIGALMACSGLPDDTCT